VPKLSLMQELVAKLGNKSSRFVIKKESNALIRYDQKQQSKSLRQLEQKILSILMIMCGKLNWKRFVRNWNQQSR